MHRKNKIVCYGFRNTLYSYSYLYLSLFIITSALILTTILKYLGVTVHRGVKKMSDMKSHGINTKTRLDLIFSG